MASVEFTPSKLNRLVVAELRGLCEQHGLESTGIKKDLVTRLVEWNEKKEASSEEGDNDTQSVEAPQKSETAVESKPEATTESEQEIAPPESTVHDTPKPTGVEEVEEPKQLEVQERKRRWAKEESDDAPASTVSTADLDKILPAVVEAPAPKPATTVSRKRPAEVPADAEPTPSIDDSERTVPSADRAATNSLRITNFVRPFTLPAVKQLLSQKEEPVLFWMDSIKTHCLVSYPSVESAEFMRNTLYNLQWPAKTGKPLKAEFVDEDDVKKACAPPVATPSAPVQTATAAPVTVTTKRVREEKKPEPQPEPVPVLSLDDLFRRTKTQPALYYLPLSDAEVAAKQAKVQTKG